MYPSGSMLNIDVSPSIDAIALYVVDIGTGAGLICWNPLGTRLYTLITTKRPHFCQVIVLSEDIFPVEKLKLLFYFS